MLNDAQWFELEPLVEARRSNFEARFRRSLGGIRTSPNGGLFGGTCFMAVARSMPFCKTQCAKIQHTRTVGSNGAGVNRFIYSTSSHIIGSESDYG